VTSQILPIDNKEITLSFPLPTFICNVCILLLLKLVRLLKAREKLCLVLRTHTPSLITISHLGNLASFIVLLAVMLSLWSHPSNKAHTLPSKLLNKSTKQKRCQFPPYTNKPCYDSFQALTGRYKGGISSFRAGHRLSPGLTHWLWANACSQYTRKQHHCKGILTAIPNKGPDRQEQAEGQHGCSSL
jgi:hypothetical protein